MIVSDLVLVGKVIPLAISWALVVRLPRVLIAIFDAGRDRVLALVTVLEALKVSKIGFLDFLAHFLLWVAHTTRARVVALSRVALGMFVRRAHLARHHCGWRLTHVIPLGPVALEIGGGVNFSIAKAFTRTIDSVRVFWCENSTQGSALIS